MLVTQMEVAVIMYIIVLFIMLIVGLSMALIHQVHLLLELLVSLGELLNGSGEGLHLPLQGVGGVFDF